MSLYGVMVEMLESGFESVGRKEVDLDVIGDDEVDDDVSAEGKRVDRSERGGSRGTHEPDAHFV